MTEKPRRRRRRGKKRVSARKNTDISRVPECFLYPDSRRIPQDPCLLSYLDSSKFLKDSLKIFRPKRFFSNHARKVVNFPSLGVGIRDKHISPTKQELGGGGPATRSVLTNVPAAGGVLILPNEHYKLAFRCPPPCKMALISFPCEKK